MHLTGLLCVLLGLSTAITACGGTDQPPQLEVGRQANFQGWGVSLAWWAELVGGWPSGDQSPIVQLLFGDPAQPSGVTADGEPLYPLGLNIVRYNIGASGPEAQCNLAFRPGAEVPTVLGSSAGGHPDLSLDPQAEILRLAQWTIGQRQGVKAYLEGFANSPPWWLLPTKCPQGDGDTTVLADSNQALVYAAYLAEVVNAFRKKGIGFTSVDPVNEPAIGWSCTKNYSCQEGAFISDDAARSSPIARPALSDVLHDTCDALGPLGVPVSAPDGNSPDETLSFVNKDLQSLSCVAQVNTHTYEHGAEPYTGDNREPLSAAVRSSGLPLWMSEFSNGPGPCGGSEDAVCTGVDLAAQIADDLNGLAPQAWIYWTAMEGPGGWGLLTDNTYPRRGQSAPPARLDGALTPSARFWAFGQYTRFIPAGSTIVPVSTPGAGNVRIVVAKTPTGGIVVVTTNPSGQEPLRIDLAPLGVPASTPVVYRTDSSQHQAAIADPTSRYKNGTLTDELPAQSVSTYLIGNAVSAPVSPLATTLIGVFGASVPSGGHQVDVTVTDAKHPTGDPTATGVVTVVYDGQQQVGSGQVIRGHAHIITTPGDPGSDFVSATYGGDRTHKRSSVCLYGRGTGPCTHGTAAPLPHHAGCPRVACGSANGVTVIVTSVQRSATNYYGDDLSGKGQFFVRMGIRIKNDGPETIAINNAHFALLDSDHIVSTTSQEGYGSKCGLTGNGDPGLTLANGADVTMPESLCFEPRGSLNSGFTVALGLDSGGEVDVPVH